MSWKHWVASAGILAGAVGGYYASQKGYLGNLFGPGTALTIDKGPNHRLAIPFSPLNLGGQGGMYFNAIGENNHAHGAIVIPSEGAGSVTSGSVTREVLQGIAELLRSEMHHDHCLGRPSSGISTSSTPPASPTTH